MDSSMPTNGQPSAASAADAQDELARIAYGSLEGIEFLEMNDGNRLGYHIYLYLHREITSIEEAIYEAKARTSVPPDELKRLIGERLAKAGVARG
jgi:hypothetical protein